MISLPYSKAESLFPQGNGQWQMQQHSQGGTFLIHIENEHLITECFQACCHKDGPKRKQKTVKASSEPCQGIGKSGAELFDMGCFSNVCAQHVDITVPAEERICLQSR